MCLVTMYGESWINHLRARLESEFERHVKRNLDNSSSLDDRDVNNLEKVSSVD